MGDVVRVEQVVELLDRRDLAAGRTIVGVRRI